MAASHGGQGSRGVSSLTQVLLCFGALLLGAAPVAKAQGSFVSVISSNANLTILREAVNAAGLTNVLSDRSLAYTLFAPTNDAFFGVLETLQVTPEELLSQPQEALQAFLLYHALPTVVNASSVPENATDVVTAAGPSLPPLTVQRTGAAVTVTSVGTTANVIAADLDAGDGIVHVVDNVLLPFYTTLAQAVEGNPELSTLYAALNAANLTEAFSDPTLTYTVFAPTDAAFARTLAYLGITPDQLLSNTALLTNVLLYHVLPTRVLSTDIPSEATTVETLGGETLVVQSTGNGVSITAKAINASVVAADIPVGVGPRSVVHVVDWAFVPFYPAVSSIAAANPDFSILTAAILAEGTYTPVITGVAPFSGTIFAPTNDAFTALLSALGLTAEQLLADTATLKLVLETHIVAGAPLTTDDLVAGVELTTINGQPLSTSYDVSSETLTVEAPGSTAVVGGRESTPTIAVFAIDTVLLPGTPSSPSAPGYGSYGGYGGYGGYGYGGYGYGGYGPYGFAPPPPPYGGYGGYGYGYYGSY